jgi:hypothetical protein
LILGAKCGILLGCNIIVYVWVHEAIERAGEEFARSVERGVDGGGEAVWESSLIGLFEECASRDESCDV